MNKWSTDCFIGSWTCLGELRDSERHATPPSWREPLVIMDLGLFLNSVQNTAVLLSDPSLVIQAWQEPANYGHAWNTSTTSRRETNSKSPPLNLCCQFLNINNHSPCGEGWCTWLRCHLDTSIDYKTVLQAIDVLLSAYKLDISQW